MPILAPGPRRAAAVAGGALAAAALAATAFAAPAREGAVSAAEPVYAWDGGPANGSGQGVSYLRCTPAVYECEDTLVAVADPGDLLAEVKAGDGAGDLDVAIYRSDADGTVAGDPVNGDAPDAEDTGTGKDARTALKKVTPGHYVVRVRVFDGIQATWKGTATLKVPPPPVPPAPAPSPVPAATPSPAAPAKPSARERRRACRRKAERIKNKRRRAKAVKRCRRAG